jgi:pimeloyl-ACP methyl ester carboxylesterase
MNFRLPFTAKMCQIKPHWLFILGQGGPGAGSPAPQDSPLSTYMLDRGYELVFLDYRGVGYSSAVSAATLERIGGPAEQAKYLQLFRADTLVKDCEAVRQWLTKDYPPEKKKWSIFGHSFGGHMSMTYLSFHPEGLRESFIVAGLGNLNKPPEEVYTAVYKKVLQRNNAYYTKYPDDILVIQEVAKKIRELGGRDGILLPTGGRLTVQRLMTLGIQLGNHGGIDRIHDLITKMKADLDIFNLLTRATLNSFDQIM